MNLILIYIARFNNLLNYEIPYVEPILERKVIRPRKKSFFTIKE